MPTRLLRERHARTKETAAMTVPGYPSTVGRVLERSARAGLVHVPVNFNARGEELEYLLTQSEPAAAFVDPALGPST